MLLSGAVRKGIIKGCDTLWELAQTIVPVHVVLTVLEHTAFFDWLISAFTPLMEFFGLPGEAAIVLVLGNLLSMYAAIGAMTAMTLSVKHITILAMMLLFSHSLPLETAICKKIGVGAFPVLSSRIGLAVVSGIVLNMFL